METPSGESVSSWDVGEVIVMQCVDLDCYEANKQWTVIIYGPGNTMTEYLYIP